MSTAQTIAMFIIAIVFFILVNRMFRITYFGAKGLFFVFLCCMLAAAAVVNWLFTFIARHYGWIIAAVVVLFILFSIGRRKSQVSDANSNKNSN